MYNLKGKNVIPIKASTTSRNVCNIIILEKWHILCGSRWLQIQFTWHNEMQ